MRSTPPAGGRPSAGEISYDYWGGVRPSAAQRPARPAEQPALGSEQGYPQQVLSSVFLNCKMWLNDGWDWEGQCWTWVSLMLQHVVHPGEPIRSFLTKPFLCAQQALCCLLACTGMVPSLEDAQSDGGAGGMQGTEAECEQCSAVCFRLLSICLLWRNMNLENSFKVCVSKAIEWVILFYFFGFQI